MSHTKLFTVSYVLILALLLPTTHCRQCAILLPNYNATDKPTFLSNSTRPLSEFNPATARVFRGTNLNSTLLPYVAALFARAVGEEIFFCTAVVVGPRTLITAGHCLAVFFEDSIIDTSISIEYYAYFGAKRTSTVGATGRQIKSIFIHPEFEVLEPSTYHNDLAYLTLFDDIPTFNAIMKVNGNSSNPVTGSVVRSIGYGAQEIFNDLDDQMEYESKDDLVKQLDVPVVSHSYCRNAWIKLVEEEGRLLEQPNITASNQFCAGYLNGGCGLCPGDSGGPVFQYDHTGTPVLLGIASLAYKCSSENVPIVFLRVQPFLSTFLRDVDLKLSNTTDVYVLPEHRRGDPVYINDGGNLSTTAIIIIAVGAGLITLTIVTVIVICVIRWNRNKSAEQTGNIEEPRPNQEQIVGDKS